MAERLLLEAMAAVDGTVTRWQAECDGLRKRGAFTASGVSGAYRNILPAGAVRDATASVYAPIAHHFGWLDLDRALSRAEPRQLGAEIGDWVSQDRTLSDVTETFGPPSLWIGGTNPFWRKIIAYTTADHDDDLICVHLWNAFANTTPDAGLRGIYTAPIVLAVRHRSGPFASSFSFTPEGLRRRPTTDQQSPMRSTVWIFQSNRARYASAVFSTWIPGSHGRPNTRSPGF